MRALWLRRVGFSLCLAFSLGYLPFRVYKKSGLERYVQLRGEVERLAEQNLTLRREALRLRAELEAFGSAAASRREPGLPLFAVERAARGELGLVRPGELVFQITTDPLAGEAP